MLAGEEIHLAAEGRADEQRVPVRDVVAHDDAGALDRRGLAAVVEAEKQDQPHQRTKKPPNEAMTHLMFHFRPSLS